MRRSSRTEVEGEQGDVSGMMESRETVDDAGVVERWRRQYFCCAYSSPKKSEAGAVSGARYVSFFFSLPSAHVRSPAGLATILHFQYPHLLSSDESTAVQTHQACPSEASTALLLSPTFFTLVSSMLVSLRLPAHWRDAAASRCSTVGGNSSRKRSVLFLRPEGVSSRTEEKGRRVTPPWLEQ
jgi:hypothetical protein